MTKTFGFSLLLTTALPVLALSVLPAPANAAEGMRINKRPALVITNDPSSSITRAPTASSTAVMRAPARQSIAPDIKPHSRPTRSKEITAAQISGSNYYDGTDTLVGRKISDLYNDLGELQSRVKSMDSHLSTIEKRNEAQSADYYAAIATISTQLQSGTTPGNPRLVKRLSTAQGVLDVLSQNVADLNGLAVEVANTATLAAFLTEAARSTYGLSGAVEEDHQKLAGLEDEINATVVDIDRLLNDVNDDITRAAAYLSTERSNLRTLSLAVSNGDMYGKALSNRPFSSAGPSGLMQQASFGGAASGPRPLVKIQFNKPNVDYEQPVYMAVNEAMEKYPDARFEIVAVHPTGGNAAQNAIESTRARRNAEKVLRSLTQMGLDGNRMDLSYAPSATATSNEVHVNIR